MSDNLFKLSDDVMEELAIQLAVPLTRSAHIEVKYPSGMPACNSFAMTYVRIHELLRQYSSLLERDAEELRQFIQDAKTTDQA